MQKPSIIFFLIFIWLGGAFAQEKIAIKGLVFEVGSNKRLANVRIEDKTSKEFTLSDDWGNFTINVSINDTLSFVKNNYQEEEKVIIQKQNLIIYLKQAIELQEVVVKQQTKKAQQQEILDGFRSKGVYYNGNPPLLAYIFTPLTALNELLGKDANNARRFGDYIHRENAESNVDAHFNKQIISESVKIKDDELVEFMYLYRPKPEDITYRNRYDDMNYIRKSYLSYLKRKKTQF